MAARCHGSVARERDASESDAENGRLDHKKVKNHQHQRVRDRRRGVRPDVSQRYDASVSVLCGKRNFHVQRGVPEVPDIPNDGAEVQRSGKIESTPCMDKNVKLRLGPPALGRNLRRRPRTCRGARHQEADHVLAEVGDEQEANDIASKIENVKAEQQ